MKLVIGGVCQGKLRYVLQTCALDDHEVFDGRFPEERELREIRAQGKTVIVNHFQSWIKSRILQGRDPEAEAAAYINGYPRTIIISDEIGNGIVPIDALEREYRERTGRILVELAGQADEVVRVLCGIGQKIK